MLFKTTAHILALILLLTAACVNAAESANNSAATTKNIGFISNFPEIAVKRFPMCNAFLNVSWINKEKRIGYTHYEARLLNDW